MSRFDLTIEGGKNGILVSNGNLCRKKQVADVDIDGQNNKPSDRNDDDDDLGLQEGQEEALSPRGQPRAGPQPNSTRSGSRSPRSTARSTSTHAIPRDSASTRACGLITCAARMPRQWPKPGCSQIRSR